MAIYLHLSEFITIGWKLYIKGKVEEYGCLVNHILINLGADLMQFGHDMIKRRVVWDKENITHV